MEKYTYLKMTNCAGCQTCGRLNDHGDVEFLPHFIGKEDITETIKKLQIKELDNKDINK